MDELREDLRRLHLIAGDIRTELDGEVLLLEELEARGATFGFDDAVRMIERLREKARVLAAEHAILLEAVGERLGLGRLVDVDRTVERDEGRGR